MHLKLKYILFKPIALLMYLLFCSFLIATQGYNLSAPTKTYTLPATLNEISGITLLNENEIACVQDELGIIYVYNLKESKITKEYKTNLVGDYEGITLVGTTIYLLRSDGVLIEYPDFREPNMKTKEYFLNLPSQNNEGLCYDMENYRLLIAAKIKPGKEIENKDLRYIYSFDLKTKTPNNIPILKLDVKNIEVTARKLNLTIPYRLNKQTKEKEDVFNFRPSEIAVHPIDRNIYILSSNDKLLLMIDKSGEIKNLIKLDPKVFNKPEGLSFASDGTMMISNEAQKGKPTLLTFNYN